METAYDMGYYWASLRHLGEEDNKNYTPDDVSDNNYNVYIYLNTRRNNRLMFGVDISRVSPGYEEISLADFLEMNGQDIEAEEISITELIEM